MGFGVGVGIRVGMFKSWVGVVGRVRGVRFAIPGIALYGSRAALHLNYLNLNYPNLNYPNLTTLTLTTLTLTYRDLNLP